MTLGRHARPGAIPGRIAIGRRRVMRRLGLLVRAAAAAMRQQAAPLLVSPLRAAAAAAAPRRHNRRPFCSGSRLAVGGPNHDGSQELFVANCYVSEGRDERRLGLFRAACGPQLVHEFVDRSYNRTGFTIGGSIDNVETVAIRLCIEAFATLDLRTAAPSSHPRTGVVDHIAVHPLVPGGSLANAAGLARRVALALSRVGGGTAVYLYGAASRTEQTLAELRRAIGYFKGCGTGSWDGVPPQQLGGLPTPDFGPGASTSLPVGHGRGVVCVGATPLVMNLNVPLAPTEAADLHVGRQIARAVSERGGGLRCARSLHTRAPPLAVAQTRHCPCSLALPVFPLNLCMCVCVYACVCCFVGRAVQAMALLHTPDADGQCRRVEIACNLLDPTAAGSTPEDVCRLVRRLAAERGLAQPAEAYSTGKTASELRRRALQAER